MSCIILTHGDVEFLPDASYLDSLLENMLAPLFQLILRQHGVGAGRNRHGQLLDGLLKRVRPRQHAGRADFLGEDPGPLQWWLGRPGGLAASIRITGNAFAGTSGRSGHHDLHATSGAIGTPAASCADSRRICSHEHLLGVLADDVGGDVDLVVAEVDEASVPRERSVAEAASVVADEAQRAETLDEAADHTLAGGDDGSRPDKKSSQRRC